MPPVVKDRWCLYRLGATKGGLSSVHSDDGSTVWVPEFRQHWSHSLISHNFKILHSTGWDLPDSAFVSSSTSKSTPSEGRLQSTNGWCAESEEKAPWLQIVRICFYQSFCCVFVLFPGWQKGVS